MLATQTPPVMFHLSSYDKFELSDLLTLRLLFLLVDVDLGGGGGHSHDWSMYRGRGGVWWGLFLTGQ